VIAAGCIGYILASIPLTVYRGWALSVLWGWFVVPLFGAPPLSIPYAIGLSLLVGFLTTHYDGSIAREKDREWWESMLGGVVYGIIGPSFALLVGWIVVQFL
jgi:phosphatidylglycerophosphate synthase